MYIRACPFACLEAGLEGRSLAPLLKDPHAPWDKPEYAAVKKELAAHFPKNPSGRKLKQFNDLTPEEIRAFNGRPRG